MLVSSLYSWTAFTSVCRSDVLLCSLLHTVFQGMYVLYAYIHCQAPGWLKTFGQFLVLGGGWCTTGANLGLAVFVHRLASARNKKFGVGKHLFWCQISIFGERLVLKIIFLGFRMHFWGSETLMKLLEGFHEVAREAWRWWSQRCVCVFISPPCTKTGQTFKSNQGISKQIIVFQAVLGFV